MKRTSIQNRCLHGMLRDYAKARIAAYASLEGVSVKTEMESLKLLAKYIANISGDTRFSDILMEKSGTKALDTASMDIFIKIFDAEFQRIWPEAAEKQVEIAEERLRLKADLKNHHK